MGTRNKGREEEQRLSNEALRTSITQSNDSFNALKGLADNLLAKKPENTEAARTIKNRGLGILKGDAAGVDKGKFISGELSFINRTARNLDATNRMARGVGGRALSGGADANLQAQLDALTGSMAKRDSSEQAAELYDDNVTDAMNMAMQGEGTENQYDQNIFANLSGVQGAANSQRDFAFQKKQYDNRPGQGVFSRYVMPFAQMAMQGAVAFCVDENTMITMSDGGQAKAGFLREGMMVRSLGESGVHVTSVITGIRSRLNNDLFEIVTENGFRLLCTPSHVLFEDFRDTEGITPDQMAEGVSRILTYSEETGFIRSRVVSLKRVKHCGRVIIFTLDGANNYITGGMVSFDDKE